MNLEQYFPYFLLTFTQQLVYKNLVILNYIYPIDVESDVEVVGMKIDACLFFHYTCGMPEENGDNIGLCESCEHNGITDVVHWAPILCVCVYVCAQADEKNWATSSP